MYPEPWREDPLPISPGLAMAKQGERPTRCTGRLGIMPDVQSGRCGILREQDGGVVDRISPATGPHGLHDITPHRQLMETHASFPSHVIRISRTRCLSSVPWNNPDASFMIPLDST